MFAKMASLSRGNSSSNLKGADKVQKTLIAVCQMNATSLKADNLQTILDLVSAASSRGAQMVFLPEACDYIGESKNQSIEYSEPLHGNFIHQLKKAAARYKVWLSVGGYHQKGPENKEKPKLINTHIIIDNEGKVRATYDKAHLFDLDIAGKIRLCESDYVIPGSKIIPPVSTPFGRIGLATCYDVRFPELSLALVQQGAQIITYPSAFTQTTGMAHWECLLRARAIETQCYVIAAAQTGKHNTKRSSYGHAMVVDPWGAIIAQCSEGVGICLAEIDLDYVAKVRSEMPVWQHRRTDLYGRVIALNSDSSTIPPDDQAIYPFGHVRITSGQVFYRTRLSVAFVNIKPVLPGHALVAPLRVAVSLSDLNPAEVTDLFLTVQQVTEVLKKHFGATSSTMAIQDGMEAGQTVQHVHVHILPRKRGDFSDNDDIYDHLQNHDKGWNEHTKLRTEAEMAEEARQLRAFFYPKPVETEEQSSDSSEDP
ncbi:Nitrilase and fragile histidine triad fusion protein NitFhit [Bulinus truncatus]|nr:Nitrilase and fragile histidine triad fusion protein NitFhit [Bulinus truncatus]